MEIAIITFKDFDGTIKSIETHADFIAQIVTAIMNQNGEVISVTKVIR